MILFLFFCGKTMERIAKKEAIPVLALIFFILLASSFQLYRFNQEKENPAKAAGDFHYVRAGATGLNNGTDWENAWTSLPATLVRGDTYYIADGEYGSYVFDDAISGELYITIKKAIESDHGTGIGWDSSYGDGQAVFSPLSFAKSFYIFDGQVGGGPGSWDYGHGFKIQGTLAEQRLVLFRGIDSWTLNLPHNISISHTDIAHRGMDTGTNDRCIYAMSSADNTSVDNITIDHCYIHDSGGVMIYTPKKTKNWIFEYNLVTRQSSSAAQHGTPWQSYGLAGAIVRYNWFRDNEGTAIIALEGSHDAADPNENWSIYGNIFSYSFGNPYNMSGVSNGVIGATSGDTANNIFIYNNTFAGIPGINAGTRFEAGSQNVRVFNNIWHNSSINKDSGFSNSSHDHNFFYSNYDYRDNLNTDLSLAALEIDSQVGAGNIFVDSANGDFRLSSPTQAGYTLSSPYNTDILGLTRGSDGVWDRGAYEYVSAAPATPTPTPTPSYQSSDLNSDTRINSIDFGILMSWWGSGARPKSDINQDGYVNSVDFGIMLSQWTG